MQKWSGWDKNEAEARGKSEQQDKGSAVTLKTVSNEGTLIPVDRLTERQSNSHSNLYGCGLEFIHSFTDFVS